MQAYAIFAGGGVKGAAFAGCLVEAEQHRIEFLGYGGASAGSLVALLASIGYTPQQIRAIMVDELDYCRFLGDGAALLRQATMLQADIAGAADSSPKIGKLLWDYWWRKARFRPIRLIHETLGLYPGNHLIDTVKQYITQRDGFTDLRNKADITFDDLHERGAKPLEIIASDLKTRRAAVFSRNDNQFGASVLDAILASTCYPFLFHPVKRGQDGYLVDGGLASNLPVFLFDEERKVNRRPIIAFDLIVPPGPTRASYFLGDFLGDLFATALEAGNALLMSSAEQIYHVQIPIPDGIHTLKFELSLQDKQQLYLAGLEATRDALNRQLGHAAAAYSTVRAIQAAFIEPVLMEAALAGFTREVERSTGCSNSRAYVMLPTGEDRQMVVYQHGMRGAPDMAWNIAINAGPSGRVRRDKTSFVVEWQHVRADPRAYNLEDGEVSQIAAERRIVYCVPIYEFRRSYGDAEAGSRPLIATLSIDTDSPIEVAGWHHQNRINPALEAASVVWGGVVSKLLS